MVVLSVCSILSVFLVVWLGLVCFWLGCVVLSVFECSECFLSVFVVRVCVRVRV